VLAGLRGDRPVRAICQEYEIAETLCFQWRDRLLEGGKAALATPRDNSGDGRDTEVREAQKRIANLEWALGRKTYEAGVAGERLRDWT
jgi:transposase